MKGEQLSTQPGIQAQMEQQPQSELATHTGTGKLRQKVAVITGGDSGIGRAVAIAFAKEGACVVISYLNEHQDAAETSRLVEEKGGECLAIAGDIGDSAFCTQVIQKTLQEFQRLDIVVNVAGEQHVQKSLADITDNQLERTFRTNVFGMFYLTRAALPHLKKGSVIINTASVTAFKGHPMLIDYSSSKGAVVSFTRALSNSLAPQGIRVNTVAPGPIWTPLIASTFPSKKVETFGHNVPLGRPGQPEEVAPSYVFLASNESSYISGQTLHVNGGKVVNG